MVFISRQLNHERRGRAFQADFWEPIMTSSGPHSSELQIPFITSIFIAGQTADLVERQFRHRLGCVPGFAQSSLEQMSGDAEVDKEIGVGTVEAIIGLPGGERQGLFDQVNVEVQQERAMKKHRMPRAALRVARELEAANGEVGMALGLDRRLKQCSQRGLVTFKDERVGCGNALQRPGSLKAEDQ